MDQCKYICTHFVQCHQPSQLSTLPDHFFKHHHLFPCHFCNDPRKIYLNEHYLHNHAHQHRPSTHPDNRLNSSLISDAFQSIPSLQNTWSTALPWLDHLEISPPPFCESHYSRITGHIHQTTHNYYGILLQLVIDSTPLLDPNYLHSHPNLPAYEYSSLPFWKLLFLFEALIFQPECSASKLSKNILHCLKLLAAGHIQELHSEMMSCPHSKPSSHARQADIDEWNQLFSHPVDDSVFQQFNSSTQRAADHDNLHAAFQQLDHAFPPCCYEY